jgi:hypothetical protein
MGKSIVIIIQISIIDICRCVARTWTQLRTNPPLTSHNKRHGGSFPLRGIHPATPALLRKARPANGLWAKPGNSQGSSLRSLALTRCGAPVHCALRALIPGAGGPTPFASSCSRLSPKTASPWRNVVFNAGAGARSLSFATQNERMKK